MPVLLWSANLPNPPLNNNLSLLPLRNGMKWSCWNRYPDYCELSLFDSMLCVFNMCVPWRRRCCLVWYLHNGLWILLVMLVLTAFKVFSPSFLSHAGWVLLYSITARYMQSHVSSWANRVDSLRKCSCMDALNMVETESSAGSSLPSSLQTFFFCLFLLLCREAINQRDGMAWYWIS